MVVPNGSVYRIITDQVGSPRLVVNASTGNVAERIEFDAWGNETDALGTEANYAPIPFGFAGGLYDPDTGLVRFGVRDYLPGVARWTAKDPLRFGGGQSNLYSYVGNDPVNLIDPRGRDNPGGVISVIDAGQLLGRGSIAVPPGIGVVGGLGAIAVGAGLSYAWWLDATATSPPDDESDCEGGTACASAPDTNICDDQIPGDPEPANDNGMCPNTGEYLRFIPGSYRRICVYDCGSLGIKEVVRFPADSCPEALPSSHWD
jgi:RHS repeat-associated protein